MRSAKPALGVSNTLSEISERIEAVRYSPDRPILWVGWDMVYSLISLSSNNFLVAFGNLFT